MNQEQEYVIPHKPADTFSPKPFLKQPEDFVRDYVIYTIHGNRGAWGKGFLSPYDMGPLYRVLHGRITIIQFLQNIAPQIKAAYVEADGGGRSFPYLVADDLADALRREQPKTVDDVKFILRKLGYSTWLKHPEGETLVELFSCLNAIPKEMRTYLEVEVDD